MWSQTCLSVGRRPVQMQGMRVSVYVDDRLGRQSLVGTDEASLAGVVRFWCAGVSAAVPGSGQHSSDPTILSSGASLLRV
jgi:hypothetical protein